MRNELGKSEQGVESGKVGIVRRGNARRGHLEYCPSDITLTIKWHKTIKYHVQNVILL